MILHLIYHLMTRRRARGPSPVEKHRNIEAEQVVIDCPRCGVLGVCKHFDIEESPGGRTANDFKHVNKIYVCSNCRQALEADNFENDGTGVLRAKQWTCTKCNTANYATQFTCAKCHTWRS